MAARLRGRVPRRGAQVVALTDADAEQLFPVMAMLEGRCALEATRRASIDDLAQLQALHDKLERAAAAADGHDRVNHDFHSLVQAIAANRWLHGLFAQPSRQRVDLVEMQTHVGLQVMARFEGEDAREGLRQLLQAGSGSAMPAATAAAEAPASLRTLECQAIERTLVAMGGNLSATAKALGISRNTIYRRRQAAAGQAG